jgi:hypothetical protein
MTNRSVSKLSMPGNQFFRWIWRVSDASISST